MQHTVRIGTYEFDYEDAEEECIFYRGGTCDLRVNPFEYNNACDWNKCPRKNVRY